MPGGSIFAKKQSQSQIMIRPTVSDNNLNGITSERRRADEIVFVVFKARVDMGLFRQLADLSAVRSKPLLHQQVYLS